MWLAQESYSSKSSGVCDYILLEIQFYYFKCNRREYTSAQSECHDNSFLEDLLAFRVISEVNEFRSSFGSEEYRRHHAFDHDAKKLYSKRLRICDSISSCSTCT